VTLSAPATMATTRAPPFQLAPLPYSEAALEPVMSARTLGLHHGKHHQAYVDNLNRLLESEADLAGLALGDLVQATVGESSKTNLFDNAAQAWNHAFFWSSMRAGGGGRPTGRIAARLEASFGSHNQFEAAFTAAAKAHFGSGWVWLIEDGSNLTVLKTANAATPLAHGKKCLLVLDLWEHAYYLDHQNRRPDYVAAYLSRLVNWEFAEANLG